MRRYRIFLIFAVIVTATVYHMSQSRHWEVSDVERFAYIGHKHDTETTEPKLVVDIPPAKPVLASTIPELKTTSVSSSTSAQTTSTSVFRFADVLKDSTTSPLQAATQTTTTAEATAILKSRPPTDEEKKAAEEVFVQEFGQHGQGRLEVEAHPPGTPMAKWEKQTERFPIPPGKMISLPSGSSKTLPMIQYKFKEELAREKEDRMQKLAVIKDAFNHSWTGYTEYALPNDELKSVSGAFTNPFNGWGATLVDALDTLWIMDMREEFEAAVEAVKKINFTTSPRKDIPLFETTIRYLGGLMSAYDLSMGKYPPLLDKAKELAEVLMGAFDTPNRMPVTYYYWAPSYASQPHRAGTRVVLAELGSLSVEFTRLAQITGERKFYDAIARITDALEKWQMETTLPGLWPAELDASGCKKPANPVEVASPVQQQPFDVAELKYGIPASAKIEKRQLDDASLSTTASQLGKGEVSRPPGQGLAMDVSQPSTIHVTGNGSVDCESQGLADVPHASKQTFSIGGMADSTYEYFPKEYLLLGGQVEQYRTMYENAIKTIKEELLFRPMTKNADDILAVGKLDLPTKIATNPRIKMTYEGTHLSCFAGGMFALGSKVFGLHEDLEIGRKLTEGCIWAYGSTTTGIMPETFEMVRCPSKSFCEWNETAWHEALDPNHESRTAALKSFNEKQKAYIEDSAKIQDEMQAEAIGGAGVPKQTSTLDFSKPLSPEEGSTLRRRQLDDLPEYPKKSSSNVDSIPTKTSPNTGDFIQDVTEQHPPTLPINPMAHYEPKPPLSHEEYVAARIRDERLPEGFTSITSTSYGLRPEAIESVFIMYRLTGEQKYRDAGWKMFEAVEGYTRTKIAHAAIEDVTATVPIFKDSMESFWLAETLKYFYLLFSEPDLISLDEWVLNTEAHPFKRTV
jgi:mannosyl-oligosaccharide alpha-1,2-mannosidase